MNQFFLSVQVPRPQSGSTRGIRGPTEKSVIYLFNSWNGKNAGIRKRKQRFTIQIRFISENFAQQIESLIFFPDLFTIIFTFSSHKEYVKEKVL